MCETCGCSDPNNTVTYTKPGEHQHHPEHHHHQEVPHTHGHHEHTHTVEINKPILGENDLLAARNRGFFEGKEIVAFNMVSSPGSGKTTLLEATIKTLKNDLRIYVIEGDQQTTNDADRIEKAGASALQVNTGDGCHLDAHMVHHAIDKLKPQNKAVLFIENVGNLVCPALFDLGETLRVVIISVTEGDDKPLKYPNMFSTSQVCVINKCDLLPYVNFDIDTFKTNALKTNPNLTFLETSATKLTGITPWIDFLNKQTN